MTSVPVSMPAEQSPTRHALLRRWWIVALLAVVLVIAGAVAWNNGLRARFIARNFGVVEPGVLFRSGQISSTLIESTLRSHGIRRIVCLTQDGPRQADIDAEVKAANDLGIDRTVYPLSGNGTGAIAVYADAIAAVAESVKAGRPTLVHCVAGAQRTGGVIACYMMLVKNRPAAEAYAEMRRFGWDPNDNPGLLKFLNAHMDELAGDLVAKGVISTKPSPLPVLPE